MTAAEKAIAETAAKAVAEFSPFEAKLAAYKDRFSGIVYDMEDKKQNAQARSDARAIGSVIAKLDSCHKDLKAPLKARVDLIDAERRRIKDELRAIQGEIKGQIDAHEEAIRAHEQALADRLAAIKVLALVGEHDSPGAIAERLHQAKAAVVDDSLEHLKGEAALAKLETIATLEAALKAATDREALAAAQRQAEEQQRAQAQAEREARIAQEAAENARKQAEQQAAQKAAQAAAERQAREANREHRARINRAATGALKAACRLTEDQARDVVSAIARNTIPNITINY